MSSFLTGVETEEDLANALRNAINAIDKASKPQSPSKKRGLEDDDSQPADISSDHRPKKQQKRSLSDSSPEYRPKKKAASKVRSKNGQLEWLDEADFRWKPADYHRKYRAQFLALSAQQPGATPWTPALGINLTSFSPLMQGWSEDRDTVRDSKGRRVFDMENPPTGWDDDPPYGHLIYNKLIMLDHEDRPVRDIPGLPLTLATTTRGWQLEGLRRCTKIEVNDFLARFPSKIGYSTLVQAMGRWTDSIHIRKWKTHAKAIKKTEPALTTSDREGSTILASPVTPQTPSGSLNVESSGQEWPSSPESSFESTHALDSPYSRNSSCKFAVGNSAPSPWDAESPVKHAVLSPHPIVQQMQLGNLNDRSSPQERPPSRETSPQSTCAYGTAYSRSIPYYSAVENSAPSPWDAESSTNPGRTVLHGRQSNRHREGHYANLHEASYYDQKNTESIVRRVINDQRKKAGIRANKPSVIPQSTSFQPHSSIRSEPQESLFSHGDFYSAQPTNIVESNFVHFMLEYSRSHYRNLMSREPPVTTYGANYIHQYHQLQAHLDRMWPYPNTPPELRSVAPVAGWFAPVAGWFAWEQD